METNKIYNLDCIDGMKQIDDNSIDSIVTDPPYGLEFMGKEWDRLGNYGQAKSKKPTPAESGQNFSERIGRVSYNATQNVKCKICNHWKFSGTPCKCDTPDFPNVKLKQSEAMQEFHYDWAVECFRILKPGGYLLSFGGTRTYHRMASAIEDAGFEIRDMINWTYGSGFPKSLNIGKAIDKLQGNEREEVEEEHWGRKNRSYETEAKVFSGNRADDIKEGKRITTKGTSEFEGWGTALKPSHEPIVVARKPLSEKSVAENVLKYGTGGINIDESRIEVDLLNEGSNAKRIDKTYVGKSAIWDNASEPTTFDGYSKGRFPANFIHDNSPEVLAEFEKAGVSKGSGKPNIGIHKANTQFGFGNSNGYRESININDSGTPARFFKSCEFEIEDAPSFIYTAKASKSERNAGLEDTEETINCDRNTECYSADVPFNRSANPKKNTHPTIKPIKLIEYLVKLVTPKNGICLDPFMGSGTTAVACKKNGFKYLGFEKETEYIDIINARLDAIKQKKLFEE